MANTKRRAVKLINASDIKNNFSMPEAINSMEEAFKILSSGQCEVPHRYVTSVANDSLTMLLKPVYEASSERAAIKIITQKVMGPIGNIPAIVGVVMVMDASTGEVLAIMDGEYITSLRTGAASGLATKYFATISAKSVAIFGCGQQGRTQLEAILAVREITNIILYDKNTTKAKILLEEFQNQTKAEIRIGANLDELNKYDIICTATNAQSPLFDFKDIKKGVHINAIGSFKPNMQELDPLLLKNASIWVEQMESCMAESGDLIKPITKGLFTANHIKGEIGSFSLEKIKGRISADEITIFKSVGVAIQDFVVANKIFEKSISKNFGSEFSFHE